MSNKQDLNIAVVGLGYVGLPTAISFHKAGFKVVGIDISQQLVNDLKNGKNHLLEENSELRIPEKSKKWNITTDFSSGIPGADLILITVPTPVTKDLKPNLDYVESAADSILKNIKRGAVVVLESTVYPGVTRNVLTKIAEKNNLTIDQDFSFAYSPERVSPGDVGRSSSEVAKIVGMDDLEKGEWLSQIYSEITSGGCTYVGVPEVAEAAKLIENTQRDIDIAFVNELAIVLPKMGLDVEDVLSAAATKWNFHKHTPGIGIGGHCIPVDPYFYIEISEKLGFKSKISTAARAINTEIEEIATNQIIKIIQSNHLESVIFLGYSYKPNVGDIRETPVEKITKKIFEKINIKSKIWDPLIQKNVLPNWTTYLDDPYQIHGKTLIVIGTAHDVVINLDFVKYANILESPIIYDGRRVLHLTNLKRDDWEIYAVGKPILER